MKVICINDKCGEDVKHLIPAIKIFEIYTVIDHSKSHSSGELHYRLLEKMYCLNGAILWWWNINFIPLSEISETVFERNYQKELV